MTKATEPLGLALKLTQKSVRGRVREFFAKGRVNPWVIEMDPTTACNLACHDCISANLLNQGGIGRERIKELAREFKEMGVRAVVLIGGGEPMAHPEFGTLVDYFYENDIHVGLTTNGTLIERHLDRLATKTKWVRISVDAGSDEIFKEFRPSPSGKSLFSTVVEGMRKLGQAKRTKFGYSFLVLQKPAGTHKIGGGQNMLTNAHDIEKAAHLALDLNCDYFEVKPSFDMMHFLQNQTNELSEIVRVQMQKIAHLASDKFKIVSPYTLNEALRGAATQPKEYHRCLTTEIRTVVTPSGVYVCPYHRGNANMRIGDINNDSLQSVWNGERRRLIIQQLDPAIHCQFHCIRHPSNQLLEKWAAEGMDKGNPPEIDDFDFFL
jgi:MoaA/NifB/PqqE/SkfB family radical SAM enzyme